jgi:hypothetical protein
MPPTTPSLQGRSLSVETAALIIKFIFNALTPQQTEQLDAWVGDNDDNMQIFEALSGLDLPLPAWPDGMARDQKAVWRFNLHADTIIKSLDQILTIEELSELKDWLDADPTNPHLYHYLHHGDPLSVQQWIDRLPLLTSDWTSS